MAVPEEPTYKIGRLQHVPGQIKDCLKLIPSREQRKAAIAALRRVVAHLQTDPTDWGDPEYRTVKAGGMVCHGVSFPFLVRYVVYEMERAVCVLNVDLLSRPNG